MSNENSKDNSIHHIIDWNMLERSRRSNTHVSSIDFVLNAFRLSLLKISSP